LHRGAPVRIIPRKWRRGHARGALANDQQERCVLTEQLLQTAAEGSVIEKRDRPHLSKARFEKWFRRISLGPVSHYSIRKRLRSWHGVPNSLSVPKLRKESESDRPATLGWNGLERKSQALPDQASQKFLILTSMPAKITVTQGLVFIWTIPKECSRCLGSPYKARGNAVRAGAHRVFSCLMCLRCSTAEVTATVVDL